jgi:endonuclease I/type IX secretion system substrate protein
MKYSLLLSFILLTNFSVAQDIIEPCKFGQPLIDALQAAYTPDNPLGYGPARDILYSEIDNNGMELSCIYTDFTVTLEAGVDPSVSAFSGGINAEHVYPQSFGAGSEPMKSDMHNIFPSKVNVNESRGNCPFNEVEDNDTDKWFYLDMQSNNIPIVDIEKYSEKDEEDCAFEPREQVKGDIARAVFYFYATYQSIANASFFSAQKNILYQWHINDPVDNTESTRNSLIALQQGNLNPFIVDSTLVRRAFFEADASYPEGDEDCYSLPTGIADMTRTDWVNISSNFIQEEVIVYSNKNKGAISIFDTQGRLIKTSNLENESPINVNDFAQGVYILHVQTEGMQSVFRFYKK